MVTPHGSWSAAAGMLLHFISRFIRAQMVNGMSIIIAASSTLAHVLIGGQDYGLKRCEKFVQQSAL